jgi:hypothetical protein
MKQTIRKRLAALLLFSFLLTFYSCSKDSESENIKNIQQEHFVGSALAKEIASEILFKTDSNSQTSKNTSASFKKSIESISEVKNDLGNIVFYIINYREGGYILLSADNREQPILAFSEDSKFELETDSSAFGFKLWINNVKKQITGIQNSTAEQTEEKKLQWRQVKNIFANYSLFAKAPVDECTEYTTTVTKGPYLQTTWWQQGGYNSALKYISCEGNNIQISAGCVPIAMAQIMKYYQKPINYNWSQMPLNSATPTTANFIADIHNSINSEYQGQPTSDCYGTSVIYYSDMATVLKNKFNYTSAIKADYNYSTVKANLNEGKPVLLSGFGNYGGHMWVCDGYSASTIYNTDCTGTSILYFHMNWGWENGKNNGYFAFSNFNPGLYTFNENIQMIYNIKP